MWPPGIGAGAVPRAFRREAQVVRLDPLAERRHPAGARTRRCRLRVRRPPRRLVRHCNLRSCDRAWVGAPRAERSSHGSRSQHLDRLQSPKPRTFEAHSPLQKRSQKRALDRSAWSCRQHRARKRDRLLSPPRGHLDPRRTQPAGELGRRRGGCGAFFDTIAMFAGPDPACSPEAAPLWCADRRACGNCAPLCAGLCSVVVLGCPRRGELLTRSVRPLAAINSRSGRSTGTLRSRLLDQRRRPAWS